MAQKSGLGHYVTVAGMDAPELCTYTTVHHQHHVYWLLAASALLRTQKYLSSNYRIGCQKSIL